MWQGSQKAPQQIKLPPPPVFVASQQCLGSIAVQTNTTMAQLTISLDSIISISSGSYVLTANYPSGESRNLTFNVEVSGKMKNIYIVIILY